MFPNQGCWNPCEFCASFQEFSPFRRRPGELLWAHLRNQMDQWIHPCDAWSLLLQDFCLRMGEWGFKGWEFLGLPSSCGWVSLEQVLNDKRDSDGWAFLVKSEVRRTVQDDPSCFCPFPSPYSSFLCLMPLQSILFCLNQYNFHCIEKLVSSALISILF